MPPLLPTVCLLLAAPAFAQPTLVEQHAHLRVVGVATASAVPDKVDVSLSIQTEEATVEAAMKENGARLASVLASAGALGIAPNDVQLAGASMSARDDYEPGGRLRGTRHQVRKDLVLCLRSPPKLDALLLELARAKVLVQRIDFVAEALANADERLTVKAVENARAQAEKLAAPLGSKVGRPLVVQAAAAGGNRGVQTYSTGGGVSVGAAATGALTTSARVEVVFELLEPVAGK